MKNFLPKQYKIDQAYKIKHNYLTEQFKDYKIILKKIEKVIKNNDFTLGTEVDLFENNIKKLLKQKYVVAVGSGTDALMLSLKCLGIQEGDEVITTPYTFYATIGAIVTAGAIPIFVDVDEDYNIDTKTRTGTPNAFSYFTQISWYAFLRRIAKEKGQVELKNKFLRSSQVGDFLLNNTDPNSVEHRVAYQYFVDTLREKIDTVKETDAAFKEFKDAKKKKKVKAADSDLSKFIAEEE